MTNEPQLLEAAELEQVSGGGSEHPLTVPGWRRRRMAAPASQSGVGSSEVSASEIDSSDLYTVSAGPVLTAEQLQARVGQIRF